MKKYVCAILMVLTTYGGVYGAANPRALATDHRVRQITYNRDNVTVINCHYDVETTIEFAPNEIITYAKAGIPSAWWVIPSENHKNIITIQPKGEDANTNLTVLTNHRVYLFELKAKEKKDLEGKDITFYVRFIYPKELNQALENRRANWMEEKKEELKKEIEKEKEQEEEKEKEKLKAENINLGYTFSGDDSTSPLAVFDNGKFTYFQFDKNADLPVIYEVNDDRTETITNTHIEGKYMVVEGLAKRYSIRYGDLVSTVIRDEEVLKRRKEKPESVVRKESYPVDW